MCNGTREVTIKTIHGSFKFTLQRYRTSEGSHSFFELTDQLSGGYISLRLQEVSSYYCEKLRQLMSMISLNRDQKRVHLKRMLSDLWHGQVESVLDYLKTQVTSKNPEKFQDWTVRSS